MADFKLSPQRMASYQQDGYILIKNFITKPEVERIYTTALNDHNMRNNALDLNDQSGKKTKLSLWFTPGDNVFGYLTRSEKMVNAVAQLMNGSSPVCHFHSKLMQKEPKVGGAEE